MVNREVRRLFNESLPEQAKADPDLRALILAAWDHVIPPPPPTIQVQRVDEYVGPGTWNTTWEVVDRRRPPGRRIVGSFTTELAARREQMKRTPVGGGSPYTFEAVDTDELFHDTDYEILASRDKYGVFDGCTYTPDAANLTVDLVVGTILFNGAPVAVAAVTDALTLVADASNERWAALTVGSAGTAVLVSGDPAASASVEPTKPEIGDRVQCELYKLQAAQTIAANAEYQLDKRILIPLGWWHIDTQILSATATSVAFTGLSDVYRMFRLTCYVDMTADMNILLRLNNDAGANYSYLGVTNAVAAVHVAAATSILLNDTLNFNSGGSDEAVFEVIVAKEVLAQRAKVYCTMAGANAGTDVVGQAQVAGGWSNTADLINRLDVLASASTFAANSRFVLEGMIARS